MTHLTNTRTRASSATLDASVKPFALCSCSLPQREGVHFHGIFEHCYNTNVAPAAVAAGAGVSTAGERRGNWTSDPIAIPEPLNSVFATATLPLPLPFPPVYYSYERCFFHNVTRVDCE